MHKTEKFFILPTYARYFGFIIIVVGMVLAATQIYSGTEISAFFKPDAELDVFAIHAMLILGCVLITFSREKTEDEYINVIRLKSFLFSVALHSLYFFIFSFTNLTLPLINFSAIILMNSLLMLYIISFYVFKKIR
jgi:hypothetical protein